MAWFKIEGGRGVRLGSIIGDQAKGEGGYRPLFLSSFVVKKYSSFYVRV